MARKADLRLLREGTVINVTSKKQEAQVILALKEVVERLRREFQVQLHHKPLWLVKEIVALLKKQFPDVDFFHYLDTSSIRPDGGVLSILDEHGNEFPILIPEKKNQGTNDARLLEGLKRQAQGNAIERLGKNVIGLKTALLSEGIFPFVCFGDGCDFFEGSKSDKPSSILDRVVTIAMFGHLNKTYLHPQGSNKEFLRGSFYFREKEWTKSEMRDVMYDIAKRSIQYYFSKYGEETFAKKRQAAEQEVRGSKSQ